MKLFFCLILLLSGVSVAQTKPAEQPGKVTFRDDGIALLEGKPFFPIAIWVYELNADVMADLHEHQFNAIVGNGFGPDNLDFIHQHGMKAVPIVTEEWVAKGKDHPALLAWCLIDEPEGRTTPQETRAKYLELKKTDPNHPIGIDHYLFDALTQYKDSVDFTMTDIYPVAADRKGQLAGVGVFIDEARRVHGPNWSHWVYIQVFGGPDTDGGRWAQPLPHEVRCMTFIALVHRANAIMYFSYWPRAPLTWASVTDLNRDLHRLLPWVLARGQEVKASSDVPGVQVRARKVGKSCMVMAVNVEPKFHTATIRVEGLGDAHLRMALENRQLVAKDGVVKDRFVPYGERVYLLGDEPEIE